MSQFISKPTPRLPAASVLATAVMAAGPGYAQIEEVVVTAQKREQSLQDVPIAVSAFGAEAIAESRIDDLQEIAFRTPSFNIGQNGPSAPELTIRGIGSTDREAGSDRSVVVFVDEVYIGRAGASTFDLFDLERVEVLRGPQGSIFGRNVVGGSVNLVTAKPEPDAEYAGISLAAGNYDLSEVGGYVNLPLKGNFASRFAVSAKTKEGYYKNRQFDDATAGNTETVSFRGHLLYEPSDDFSILWTLEAASDEMDGIGSAITQGQTSDSEWNAEFNRRFGGSRPHSTLVGGEPSGRSAYLVDNNEFGFFERDLYAVSARLDWTADFGVVTVLPAFRSSNFSIVRDLVGIPIGDANRVLVGPDTQGFAEGLGFESTAINDEKYDAFTLEARWASRPDREGIFSWLTGLYYLREDIQRDQIRERHFGQLSGHTISRPLFDQSNQVDSYAAFGQLRWEFLDGAMGLTFGARYTKDKKNFGLDVSDTLSDADKAAIDASFQANVGGEGADKLTFSLSPASMEFATTANSSFDEFTPEGIFEVHLTEDAFAYIKISTGFKSGGFVGLGANRGQGEHTYEPETVLNFETGLKGDFFDNRLRLNADAFVMSFDQLQLRDRQLLVAGDEASAIVTIVNAAQAEIEGIEADIVFNPTPALLFTGSLSFLEAEISDVAEGSTIRVGTKLPKAPEVSSTWSVNYTFPQAGPGAFTLRGEVQYRDEFFFDINEDTAGHENDLTMYNARITYAVESDGWSISLWGKNLSNEYYRTQVQSAFGDDVGIISTLGEPRTFGLSFQWDNR